MVRVGVAGVNLIKNCMPGEHFNRLLLSITILLQENVQLTLFN